MNENKVAKPRDYKERFEFEFTFNGIIICQRYFRINEFNPKSLRSYELTEAIRRCAMIIDNDLKDKTHAYLEMYAPMSFNSEDEMNTYLSNPYNVSRLRMGEGLVVRGNKETDYVLTDKGVARPLGYKFDDGELTEMTPEEGKVTYKFAFKVDGRETCSIVWDGYYPKFVRDKIDLSNKRGKYDTEDASRLSFEQYLLYKMVQGRNDLVYGLIKNICQVCSLEEGRKYTVRKNKVLEALKKTKDREFLRVL